jgi:hypothetical protein
MRPAAGKRQGTGTVVFDALIGPLEVIVVLAIIAIIAIAGRWAEALRAPPAEAAHTGDGTHDDRSTTGAA